ncbi:hybrid sensor histidine kinase/response regulator [Oceanobacter mangrovi]|uniref:hybrid sensor histidine kinase/response regulator n=1 Tax=Oceanobacter mangrovi TaxID=2862510 RepID=UPI001C8D582C|nr:response regulator [Oceanobacter mangrovi]
MDKTRKRISITTLFLLLMLGFGSLPAHAVGPVLIPEGEFCHNISNYVALLKDATGTITAQQLTDPTTQLLFEPNHSDIIQLQDNRASYWLRLSLHNPYQQTSPVVLLLNNARLLDITSFAAAADSNLIDASVTPLSPAAGYQQHHSILVNIPPLSTRTYLLEIKQDGYINSTLEIASIGYYHSSETTGTLLFSLAIGWLLATSAYFLRLSWFRRSRLAIYAAGHCGFSAIFLAISYGITNEVLGLSADAGKYLALLALGLTLASRQLALRLLDWTGVSANRIRAIFFYNALFALLATLLMVVLPQYQTQANQLALVLITELVTALVLVLGSSLREEPRRILFSGSLVSLAALMMMLMLMLSMLTFTFWLPYLSLGVPVVLAASLVFATFKLGQGTYAPLEMKERGVSVSPAMLSQIGHELRTPINGVLGMNELLSDTPMSDSQRDFTDTISQAGREILHVANEISVLAKIQDDHLQLDTRSFDLANLINQTLAHFQQEANRKQVELVADFSDELPGRVIGDRNRLQTLLHSLYSRLISYNEQGELRTHLTPLLDAKGKLTSISIQIQLQGTFSNRDDIRILVDQLNTSSSEQNRYWAIMVAQHLMRNMKASIELERLSHQDASMTLYIPLQAEEESSSQPTQDDSLIGYSVLVVDDNASLRKVIEKQTRRWGVRADSTHSGKEALAMMRNQASIGQPYDAVIIDQDMPVMNGMELMQRLTDDESIQPKPNALMLTGLSINTVREQANAVGIYNLLGKPASGERLKQALLQLKYRPGRPLD